MLTKLFTRVLLSLFGLSVLSTALISVPISGDMGRLRAESGYNSLAAGMLKAPHVEDEILVQYKSGSFKAQSLLAESDQVSIVADHLKLKISEDEVLEDKIIELLKDPEVQNVQPNYLYEMTWTQGASTAKPAGYNDTNNWYYNLSKLPEMWKDQGCPTGPLCGGSKDVIVAVIDTGLAFEQYDDRSGYTGVLYNADPEYSNINLYRNPKEIPNNGIDDDCNGIVDDYNGADTYMASVLTGSTCVNNLPVKNLNANYRRAGHPLDTDGHGSYVTGLIAGNVTNGLTAGFDSVSPAFKVSIMPIAALRHFGTLYTGEALVRAVEYARKQGAHVINMSVGGSGGSDFALEWALDRAAKAGIVLVAGSGNDSGAVNYPAADKNVIAVGAVNANGTKTYYSSFGPQIDVVAYVGDQWIAGASTYQSSLSCFARSGYRCSTDPTSAGYITNATFGGRYAIGTSFAGPQVAALAALIKSRNFGLTAAEIKQIIISTARDLGTPGKDNNTGYGVIDFQKAWKAAEVNTARVYRFWSDKNQKHFYTISQAEKNQVQASYSQDVWRYERVAFSAYERQAQKSYLPVYRFWSDEKQAHFYTISEAEKNEVVAKYPRYVWNYERVAFYAATSPITGTKPLFRFWSDKNQAHFYTSDAAERDQVRASYPEWVWKYEGVAFYVF